MVLLVALHRYIFLVRAFLLVVLSIQMGCVLFYQYHLRLADLVGQVLLPDIVLHCWHLHDLWLG
jgi:hypothetical protein